MNFLPSPPSLILARLCRTCFCSADFFRSYVLGNNGCCLPFYIQGCGHARFLIFATCHLPSNEWEFPFISVLLDLVADRVNFLAYTAIGMTNWCKKVYGKQTAQTVSIYLVSHSICWYNQSAFSRDLPPSCQVEAMSLSWKPIFGL